MTVTASVQDTEGWQRPRKCVHTHVCVCCVCVLVVLVFHALAIDKALSSPALGLPHSLCTEVEFSAPCLGFTCGLFPGSVLRVSLR